MSVQSWSETVITAQGAGGNISGVAAASILPAQAKFTFPQNTWAYPGKAMRITGAGKLTTASSSPGTLTLDIRFGATVVFNGAASATLQTSKTTVPILFEILMTLQVTGSSANFMGQGKWCSDGLTATSGLWVPMPDTTPAAGNNFDATATQQLDCFATLGSASDTITLLQFIVEVLN